jgi:hypothetical protein
MLSREANTMGSRNIRKAEKKKPRKDLKKTITPSIAPTPLQVEVIRKGKKEPEPEE